MGGAGPRGGVSMAAAVPGVVAPRAAAVPPVVPRAGVPKAAAVPGVVAPRAAAVPPVVPRAGAPKAAAVPPVVKRAAARVMRAADQAVTLGAPRPVISADGEAL